MCVAFRVSAHGVTYLLKLQEDQCRQTGKLVIAECATLIGLIGLGWLLMKSCVPTIEQRHLVINSETAGQYGVQNLLSLSMPNVTSLDLSDGTIDNAMLSLIPITVAQQLGSLVLRGSHVSDGVGRQIQRFSELCYLDISKTRLTRFAVRLRRCQVIDCSHTRLGDDSVAAIVRGCTELRTLSIAGTAVTEDVIDIIKTAGRIKSLDISGCAISDDAVTRLPRLELLRLSIEQVANESKLRQSMDRVVIEEYSSAPVEYQVPPRQK